MKNRTHDRLLWTLLLAGALAPGCSSLPQAMGGGAAAGRGKPWGIIDGKPVRLYTLRNDGGMTMTVTNYGAIITSLRAPDRDGQFEDIVLGYDHLDGYIAKTPYFGALVGRCANRIANGRFELGGQTHQVALNDGPNHLHGGLRGFDKHVWDARLLDTDAGEAIELTRTSPDGEEAYPGELTVTVRYTLTDDNRVLVDMTATTDQTTLCNLAQHTYWNLAGHDSGSIRDHLLTIHADRYTPVNETLIPTGEIVPVRGTPFDFTQPKPIGRDLREVGGDPIGYDHNFVVNGAPFEMKTVAEVVDPESGRKMVLRSNQPGVQFYSGNFLDGTLTGKGGAVYEQYQALCLETQVYPDAIHNPDWPQAILEPGETYHHRMVIAFSTVPQ